MFLFKNKRQQQQHYQVITTTRMRYIKIFFLNVLEKVKGKNKTSNGSFQQHHRQH